MNKLFEKFSRGEIPNIIELMAAISEIADYWPANPCLDCHTYQDIDSALEDAPESIF